MRVPGCSGRRKLTFALLLILGLRGSAFAQPTRSAPARLPAAHRHAGVIGDVRQEVADEITLADTAMPAGTIREGVISDRRGRFDAFTTRQRDGFRLFVVDRRTGIVREIRGVPFEWRPVSDLAWVGDRTLLFDRWSSPHFGVHYAVDVVRGTVIVAKTFHDD